MATKSTWKETEREIKQLAKQLIDKGYRRITITPNQYMLKPRGVFGGKKKIRGWRVWYAK